MKSEIRHTSSAKIWLDEEDIIRAVITKDTRLTLKDAVENVSTIAKCTDEPRFLLADVRCVNSVSVELRDYFASVEVAGILPTRAILVASPVAKVMGNMFLKMIRPKFMAKIFIDELEAVNWLKWIKSNHEVYES